VPRSQIRKERTGDGTKWQAGQPSWVGPTKALSPFTFVASALCFVAHAQASMVYCNDAVARRGRMESDPVQMRFAQPPVFAVVPQVGSPETAARKIAKNLPMLGATRFDLKFGMPGMSQATRMKDVELYGTKVVPRVRELLSAARLA
jgi:hypothetical protein